MDSSEGHESKKDKLGNDSPLSVEKEDRGHTEPSPGTESSPPYRALLDVPRLVTEQDSILYRYLYIVSTLNDEEIWTCGDDKIMKLYNVKGELVETVRTKTGNKPYDIEATRGGDLVYTDYDDDSINLVSGSQVRTLIRLRGWRPLGVCSSSSGDLLVVVRNYDETQTKVVRYSGSTEKQKQSIQWDDQGQPLYKSAGYLCENRNLDICVTDWSAQAVVVVSAAGYLRFRYTGPPTTKVYFHPHGVTTDSHANILTADGNGRIHIIDQDGHFICFIENCGLSRPWGVCVDSRDNLIVAECLSRKMKIIQYYK